MERELYVPSYGESVRLLLWDTAGQEMFSVLTRSYYRGSSAVIYVFSTTDRESFLSIPRWKEKVESELGGIVSVLVQNKIDRLQEAQVTAAEVEQLSRSLGLRLYRTAVSDNLLVDDVFTHIAEQCLKAGSQAADSVPQIGELTVREDAAERQPAAAAGGDDAAQDESGTGAAASDVSDGDERHQDGSDGSEPVAVAAASEADARAGSSSAAAGKRRRRARKDEVSSGAFQLSPLTVRTNGKKRNAMMQLCSIV